MKFYLIIPQKSYNTFIVRAIINSRKLRALYILYQIFTPSEYRAFAQAHPLAPVEREREKSFSRHAFGRRDLEQGRTWTSSYAREEGVTPTTSFFSVSLSLSTARARAGENCIYYTAGDVYYIRGKSRVKKKNFLKIAQSSRATVRRKMYFLNIYMTYI